MRQKYDQLFQLEWHLAIRLFKRSFKIISKCVDLQMSTDVTWCHQFFWCAVQRACRLLLRDRSCRRSWGITDTRPNIVLQLFLNITRPSATRMPFPKCDWVSFLRLKVMLCPSSTDRAPQINCSSSWWLWQKENKEWMIYTLHLQLLSEY